MPSKVGNLFYAWQDMTEDERLTFVAEVNHYNNMSDKPQRLGYGSVTLNDGGGEVVTLDQSIEDLSGDPDPDFNEVG